MSSLLIISPPKRSAHMHIYAAASSVQQSAGTTGLLRAVRSAQPAATTTQVQRQPPRRRHRRTAKLYCALLSLRAPRRPAPPLTFVVGAACRCAPLARARCFVGVAVCAAPPLAGCLLRVAVSLLYCCCQLCRVTVMHPPDPVGGSTVILASSYAPSKSHALHRINARNSSLSVAVVQLPRRIIDKLCISVSLSATLYVLVSSAAPFALRLRGTLSAAISSVHLIFYTFKINQSTHNNIYHMLYGYIYALYVYTT